jgi:hypothetical protein
MPMIANAAVLLTGLCLLGGLAIPASAAEATPVFTLPLGERLDRKLPKCGKPERPRRDFCGLKSAVSPAAKNRLFMLDKPDQLLPEWVGPGPARLFLGAAGHIDAVAVEVNPGDERKAIASIARRFGPADNTDTAASGNRTTRWRRGGVLIELMCEQDACLANFLSPAGARSRLAMQALRRPRSDTP